MDIQEIIDDFRDLLVRSEQYNRDYFLEALYDRVHLLQQALSEQQKDTEILNVDSEPDYDCGCISDNGGGAVHWWHNYIRSEIACCNEYWRSIIKNQDLITKAKEKR